jgi:hypothetical protein
VDGFASVVFVVSFDEDELSDEEDDADSDEVALARESVR